MIVRLTICTMLFAMVAVYSGCCGPNGRVSQCNGCNDGYAGDSCAYRPVGPLDALMSWRKQAVCGSGCGEVYYGEWVSTPPDACDPCCGDQFVGGATPCEPFCWQPGTIFGNLGGLYGSRMCDFCGNAFTDCGCGDGYVDAGYIDGGVVDGGYDEVIYDQGGGGCSTCSSKSRAGNSRVARRTTRARGQQSMTQKHYQQQRRTAQRR